jgi:hypothetical protein
MRSYIFVFALSPAPPYGYCAWRRRCATALQCPQRDGARGDIVAIIATAAAVLTPATSITIKENSGADEWRVPDMEWSGHSPSESG